MEKRQQLLDLVPKPPDWSIDWTKIQDSPVSPWIAQMKTIPQNPVWHGEGDVWTHTCMVCRDLTAMPAWRMADRRRQEELFLAALLHDIGKIPCTRMEAGSWISPNHSAVGSRMAREILWLTFGFCGNPDVQSFRETICSLIRYHSLPLHILEQVEPERCAIKTASVGKLARDFSLWMLWILALADMRGRICGDREEALEAVELFRVQAEEAGCLEAPYVFPDPCSEYAYLSGKKIRPGQGFFDDSWGEAILLSGLPGTGKDTWISAHADGYPEISLDKIREQMKISPRDNQAAVANAARELAKNYLRKQIPFVWNATDLTAAIREKQIRLFTDYHASVRIVYLETEWEEELKRNAGRQKAVPEAAIRDMMRKMTLPESFEAHRVQWHCV